LLNQIEKKSSKMLLGLVCQKNFGTDCNGTNSFKDCLMKLS